MIDSPLQKANFTILTDLILEVLESENISIKSKFKEVTFEIVNKYAHSIHEKYKINPAVDYNTCFSKESLVTLVDFYECSEDYKKATEKWSILRKFKRK